MNTLIIKSLILSFIFLTGCTKQPDEHNHPKLTSGKQFFEYHCAECHQPNARGKIFYGYPSLVDTQLDIRTIKDQLRGHGAADRKMPSYKAMPDEERQAIAEYIISLQ